MHDHKLARMALVMMLLGLGCAAAQAGPQAEAAAPDEAVSDALRQRLLRCYHGLQPQQIEQHRLAALPAGARFVRVDASERVRSASFGHSTTLLVPAGRPGAPADPASASEFFVEYGRSTNRPGGLFGPFPLR